MKGKPRYKLEIDGKILLVTEDVDVFNQVKEDVVVYIERYGKQGLPDFIDMLKEEYA